VLDTFMGSGTTAVACLKTGRNYIGFELDEKYHAIAQQRIADTVDELMEDEEI
jgi:site-specific DNA-methyltransferase (adenine-specific)